MKKIFMILSLLISLYAREQKLSDIEPAREFYVDLSTSYCDKECLIAYLERGLYFDFLANYKSSNSDDVLANIYAKLQNSVLDFQSDLSKKSSIKLALIIPQDTIKVYSNILINSSISYLLRQHANIKVKVFLIGSENKDSIKNALANIKALKYEYVIAGMTKLGASYLEKYVDDIKVFVPTLNKDEINSENENIFYGGVDYKAQINELLKYSNEKIKIFSNNSPVSQRLNKEILNIYPAAKIYTITDSSFDFKRFLKKNNSFNNASIFFNTPLIKTALASSQLRSYELRPKVLLSTQINYNPILLHLTQQADIKNFLFANSIQNEDKTLAYLNDIFNQNINYNWVAYSTSIGLDYFYTKFLNKKAKSLFAESFDDRQIKYNVKIMYSKGYGFEELENKGEDK